MNNIHGFECRETGRFKAACFIIGFKFYGLQILL